MKRKLARIAISALILSLILLPSTISFAASDNLIKNGDFSKNEESNPTYWEKSSYIDDPDYTNIYTDEQDGNAYLAIENNIENDAALKQQITVKPNTLYKLYCDIMASGIPEDSKGANITAEGILQTSDDLFDTGGKWESAVMYGRTAWNQTTLAVTLRLGGYGKMNTGYAAFDNVVVEEVSSVPSGFTAADLSPIPKEDYNPSVGSKSQNGWEDNTSFWLVIALLFTVIAFMVYRLVFAKDTFSLHKTKSPYIFLIGIIIAFSLRIILAAISKGHPTDMTCFKGWANYSAENGLLNLYNGNIFADYPPGYMYVLYILGLLGKAFNLGYNGMGFAILIKIPAIAADIAVACIIYRYANKNFGRVKATALGLLFAFAPFTFYNSSIWGQIDSILMLLIICSFQAYIKKRYVLTGIIFALAILVKPQALMIAPLALIAIIYDAITSERRRSLWVILSCLLSALIVFVIGILPFCFSTHDPFWFVDKYLSTMGEYQFASVNAFNLFFLMGGNWFDISSVTDPNGSPMPITFRILGYAFIAAAIIYSIVLYIIGKDRKHIYHISALLIALIFTFGHSMHERYLIPAVFLLIFAYIQMKDKRLLFITAGYALTTMINMSYVESGGYPDRTMIPMLASLLNVILTASLAYISYDHAIWKKKADLNQIPGEEQA